MVQLTGFWVVHIGLNLRCQKVIFFLRVVHLHPPGTTCLRPCMSLGDARTWNRRQSRAFRLLSLTVYCRAMVSYLFFLFMRDNVSTLLSGSSPLCSPLVLGRGTSVETYLGYFIPKVRSKSISGGSPIPLFVLVKLSY